MNDNTSQNPSSDVSSDRQRLQDLISELAVVPGKVILSSGKEADYYVDLRRVTLHHEASELVGQLMLEMINTADLSQAVDSTGGLTMGADPVGTAIMYASRRTEGSQSSSEPNAKNSNLDSFVVRKAQKSYGMGRQVEGPSVENKNVVVVEDTSTTGGSALTAVDALKEAGAHVMAVAVIVDRDTGAKERIERQAGVPYLALYSKDDLDLH